MKQNVTIKNKAREMKEAKRYRELCVNCDQNPNTFTIAFTLLHQIDGSSLH